MLWPSLENIISHRFTYAEFREPPTVEASHLAMMLAKKCQLSMKTSSLAPPNFKHRLTTKPFSYETLKRQVYLKPTFTHSDPKAVYARCDLRMNSFPAPLSGLLHQFFFLLSTLCSSLQSLQSCISLYSGLNLYITSLEKPSKITQVKVPTLFQHIIYLVLV